MNQVVLNRIFLIVGLIGLPICIWQERKTHMVTSLLGIGLFGYLILSSVFIEIRNLIQK